MTHRLPNSDAIALNKAWKQQQQQKRQAAQQKPAEVVHHDVIAADKPAVIHPGTPVQQGATPAECQNCNVHKKCRAILKLWHKRKPRPELARAWCQLIDQAAPEMPCLSALRSGTGYEAKP
jgi:hypothetical protein